ncbi:hypothetical protein PspLS_10414 [Pyricularia sp. CBS 133598]|nr:hypothetical protein PspLS_10414 [Pyricularia sp. CBS 133598]
MAATEDGKAAARRLNHSASKFHVNIMEEHEKEMTDRPTIATPIKVEFGASKASAGDKPTTKGSESVAQVNTASNSDAAGAKVYFVNLRHRHRRIAYHSHHHL